MNYFVVGSGGREHALGWSLAQEAGDNLVAWGPGNGGTDLNFRLDVNNFEAVRTAASDFGADLVVIGPDDPLAGGIVDHLSSAGLKVFGPNQSAARFESSKMFAKDFMLRHGIPTAAYEVFDDANRALECCRRFGFPCVIKADGLALGKGVVIAQDEETARATLTAMIEEKSFGAAGERVVVEEYLEGLECSLHALVAGERALALEPAMDHKRIGEGDTGPNTGGMGTVSPPRFLSDALRAETHQTVLDRFLAGIQSEGIDFRGLLFPGIMLTKKGPRVLEFNARFGDPETQVLMRRLASPLSELLFATVENRLSEVSPRWREEAAICLVAAAPGYPGTCPKGLPLQGLEQAAALEDVVVFHAGTKRADDGEIVTNGGRVLGVTALGADIGEARSKALGAMQSISFEGMQFRRDIGVRAESAL